MLKRYTIIIILTLLAILAIGCSQSKSDDDQALRSIPSAAIGHDEPFDQAHDEPFDQAHDEPFDQAHDEPFDQAHDEPIAPSATAYRQTDDPRPAAKAQTTDTPTAAADQAQPLPLAPTATAYRRVGDSSLEAFRQGLTNEAQVWLDKLPAASLYHISLQISPDMLLLQGQQQVHYTNQEDVPLDEIYFHLFPNTAGGKLSVSDVQVDDQLVEASYEFQDSVLRVPLPSSLEPGAQISIQMDFAVQVPQVMGGNYGLFGYFDGVLVLDEFYPQVSVYDDEGWNVQVPPPNGDLTYLDASFYLVRVQAPAELTIVASGVEIECKEQGDAQTLTIAAGPVRDFYLAASERYTVVSQTIGETTVNSYAPPEYAQGAQIALKTAVDALQSFAARFGPYPYTEFDVVSTPMLALGIEYPGMTGIALGLYELDSKDDGMPTAILLETVVAHEVAHQWFYNVVGNDQVGEPWLDEAIVQYAVWLYYLDTHGKSAAQDYRDSWDERWNAVERAELPIGLPSGDYASNEYSPIVYGRGPIFVEVLAQDMGQDVFDAFLRDYYQSHQWGIGTSEAFYQLAEQHCQCHLGELFAAWVYPLGDEADDQQTAELAADEIATLGSLTRVHDFPLYTMHYCGDYSQVARGVHTFSAAAPPPAWACSLFAALGDPDNMLYGRNFDWRYSPALLLFTDPPDGYASVSMVDIEYLVGEDQARTLLDLPLEQRTALLQAPLWPFDGMNEHGLVIGMAAVPAGGETPDPDEDTLGSLVIMREVLDHAQDVDEAIAILQNYNIDWEGGPSLHYLVADRSGRALLLEFYQGEVVITPNEQAWHLATNFIRTAAGETAQGQCWRYDKINHQLSQTGGRLDAPGALNLLSDVSQKDTQWSIVYGISSGEVSVALGRDYEQPYTTQFDELPTPDL